MQKERSVNIVCVLFSHQDFATRSLKMSEESLAALVAEDTDATDIQQYEMRRTWESRCVTSKIVCLRNWLRELSSILPL